MYNFLHKINFLHWLEAKLNSAKNPLYKLFDFFYRRINTVVSKKIAGVKYKIPVKKGLGLNNLTPGYENWMAEFIPELNLPDDSEILDVGANTGQTLIRISSVQKYGKYIAAEPGKECAEYLAELVELNKLENVEILNKALSETTGELKLYRRTRDDLMATTSPGNRRITDAYHYNTIDALKGDELGITPSLIKIDVEGGELEVLKGLKETISKSKPYILCEVLPPKSKYKDIQKFREDRAKELVSLLESLNSKIYLIHEKILIPFTGDFSTNISYCNYLFLHETKTEEFAHLISYEFEISKL